MNGRVYDPVLGRFLSADPFVDDATDANSYNRYAYCGNDPLGSTDPSGFFSLKQILPVIIAIVVTIVVTICTYGTGTTGCLSSFGTILSGAATGGAGTAGMMTAVVVGGAAGGFAGGFSGSLLNGGSLGDAFKSGIIGGICGAVTAYASAEIGGVFGEIGSFGKEVARAAAHGVIGGAVSELQGGEFRHGFYSSFAGSAAGSIAPRLGLPGYTNRSTGAIAARTAFAAVVGGTTSELAGGKFANGATTAAFQHLFNTEHRTINDIAMDRLIAHSKLINDDNLGRAGFVESGISIYELGGEVHIGDPFSGNVTADTKIFPEGPRGFGKVIGPTQFHDNLPVGARLLTGMHTHASGPFVTYPSVGDMRWSIHNKVPIYMVNPANGSYRYYFTAGEINETPAFFRGHGFFDSKGRASTLRFEEYIESTQRSYTSKELKR